MATSSMATDISRAEEAKDSEQLSRHTIPHLPYEIFLQVVESFIADAISEAAKHPMSLSIQEPESRDETYGKHKLLLGKHQFIRRSYISHRFDLVRSFHQIDRRTRRMVASAFVQLPIIPFDIGRTYIWVCPQVDAFQIIFPPRFYCSLRRSPTLHLVQHVAVNPDELCFAMFEEMAFILMELPALKSVTLISHFLATLGLQYFSARANVRAPEKGDCHSKDYPFDNNLFQELLSAESLLDGLMWAPIWKRKFAVYVTGYFKDFVFRREIQVVRHQNNDNSSTGNTDGGSLRMRFMDPECPCYDIEHSIRVGK